MSKWAGFNIIVNETDVYTQRMSVKISPLLWLVVLAAGCCVLPTARAQTLTDVFSLLQTHHQQQQKLLQKIEGIEQQLTLLQEEVSGCMCKENEEDDTGKPADCSEVSSHRDGMYRIYPEGPFKSGGTWVVCDQTVNRGGWTVIQQRFNGSQDFNRSWFAYEVGFGHIRSEFWLGNARTSQISGQKDYMLRVELEDFEGGKRYAEYDFFRVDGPKYKLHLGSYSGNAGDSLTLHANQNFSTYDVDNDSYGGSCSQSFKGAWWYKACHQSNLNGLYLGGEHSSYADGVNWLAWRGYFYSLKATRMMIRPKDF